MNFYPCHLCSLILSVGLLGTCDLLAAEQEVGLFEEALTISKRFEPQLQVDDCRNAFQKLTAAIQQELKTASAENGGNKLGPKDIAEVLNKHLFVDRQVTYLSNVYWRDSIFTSALLQKRGNCMATSLLYYLAACELRLPIRIAFGPEHAFVRWDDGQTLFNIETTANGKFLDDHILMDHFDITEQDRDENGFIKTVQGTERKDAHCLHPFKNRVKTS